MSAHFATSADYLQRTTGLPSPSGNRTIMCWVRTRSSQPVSPGYRFFYGLLDDPVGYNAYIEIWAAASDAGGGLSPNRVYLEAWNATVAPPPAPRVNDADVAPLTWKHYAFVSNGTSHTLYVNGVSAGSVTCDTSGDTWGYEMLGGDTYSEGDLEIAYARAFDAVLNATQIQAEMWSRTAIYASPRWDTPLHTDLLDVSGNGRHWTAVGSVTYGDEPGVALQPPTVTAVAGIVQNLSYNYKQAYLTWTHDGIGTTYFDVERCSGAGCTGFASYATVSPSTARARVVGASGDPEDTIYRVRVRARHYGGAVGAWSNIITYRSGKTVSDIGLFSGSQVTGNTTVAPSSSYRENFLTFSVDQSVLPEGGFVAIAKFTLCGYCENNGAPYALGLWAHGQFYCASAIGGFDPGASYPDGLRGTTYWNLLTEDTVTHCIVGGVASRWTNPVNRLRTPAAGNWAAFTRDEFLAHTFGWWQERANGNTIYSLTFGKDTITSFSINAILYAYDILDGGGVVDADVIEAPPTATLSVYSRAPSLRLGEFEPEVGGNFGPLLWAEWTGPDSTRRYWAVVDLPDPATYYGGYKAPKLIEAGVVARALSDEDGTYQSQRFSATFSDIDYEVRTLLGQADYRRLLVNTQLVLRMISDPDRRALLTPRTVAVGLVRGYTLE